MLLLLLLCMMLRKMVHVRRGGQSNIWLCEEGVQLGSRVLLRVVALLLLMVGWVLPLLLLLLLLLLSVALTAAPAPSRAPRTATSVFRYCNICAGGLRKRALQHVQGGHHRALFDLAGLVLVSPVVVVSCCHLQSLRLQLQLELGGLRLRGSLVFTRAKSGAGTLHHGLLLADGVLLLRVRVHLMMLLVL